MCMAVFIAVVSDLEYVPGVMGVFLTGTSLAGL